MSPRKIDQQLFLEIYESYQDEQNGAYVRRSKVYSDNRIGRSDDCDLTIYSNTLSSVHASFHYDSEKQVWRIKDLNSSNGIVLNDERVFTHELQEGDKIHLGEVLLVVRLKAAEIEKTETFTILDEHRKHWHMGKILSTLVMSVVFLFLHFKIGYFQTAQDIYKNLLSLFLMWLGAWLISCSLSWLNLKKFQAVRFALFQLQSLIVLGLVASLYPLFSVSLLSPALASNLADGIEYALLAFYLWYCVKSLQRFPSSIRAAWIAAVILGGIAIGSNVYDYFTEQTSFGTQYAHPFFLPPESNDLSALIEKLDQTFKSE